MKYTYRQDTGIGSIGWVIVASDGTIATRVAGSEEVARLTARSYSTVK
jgi:hypothetical protein